MIPLHNNQIFTLPPNIGKLIKLSHLDARNNIITEIPRSIGKLKELTYLDARNNEIGKIPKEIFSGCLNLERLFLSNNRIKTIPKSICKLEKLSDLLLDNNRLLDVPDCLFQKHIPILKLRGNKDLVRKNSRKVFVKIVNILKKSVFVILNFFCFCGEKFLGFAYF